VGAWPVSDDRGVAGIVSIAILEKAAADGLSNSRLIDLIGGEEFPHLHSDQPLTVALERMGAAGLDALPVVSRADVHKLEGIVALQDVLKVYGFAAQAEQAGRSGGT
jgi:CBS domain-containing protein